MRREFAVIVLVLISGAAPASAQMMGIGRGPMISLPNAGSGDRQMPDDYATARRLMHFGKYADAIPLLNSARHQQPHNADIIAYLGYSHHMIGENELAHDEYQWALTEDPDNLLAHEYLGEFYLDGNYPASAQQQLSELVRLCPSGCDARDALTKAIAAYRTQAKSTH